MILAASILGLEIFGTVWWIIASIVCVILLTLVGVAVALSDSFLIDGDELVIASLLSVIASAFWLFTLGVVVVFGFFAVPILTGIHIGKWAERKEKKRKEKEKFMNQIDKMKKTKGVD